MALPLVGFCESGVKVKDPLLENITLKELSKHLTTVETGTKDGSYFLRTKVLDTSKGRSDTNTASMASALILDADSTINTETGETTEGAPCPYKVHESLKAVGINHLIYRSYSHATKGNRYRIIFITDRPYNRAELAPTVSHALTLCGEPIANVKENCTWSQGWYLPRKPECDTSEFTQLSYTDGEPLPVQEPLPDFNTYKPKQTHQHGLSPIQAYNAQSTIEAELSTRGDTQHGNKWLYHASTSKEPGICVKDNIMFSHHGSDPLNDGKAHDCFDIMQSRLDLNLTDAIKYAAQHTQAPNGQTVDKFNKANNQITPQQTPANITFNELSLFKEAELKPVLLAPFNALPAPLEVWANDVSSRIGCAPDYLIVCVLTVLSSLLGRKVLIKPKQKHDWEVVVNLFGAIIGSPSTKKTPSLNEGLYYINNQDIQARLDNKEAQSRYRAEVKLQKLHEKEVEAAAKKEAKKDKESALRMLQALEAELEKPLEKRFTACDVTVERFAMLLADNPNGILIVRDELSGLMSYLDREENAPTRAFFLQMFNGNQSYS